MTFTAWNVIRAPKVLFHTPKDHFQPITLQHLSTQIIDITKSGCAVGNAVWGAVVDGQEVFVAFDWQEMQQGVALLMDPNAIISNLSFVDTDGDEEPLLRQIVSLTCLLHITPWQSVAVSEADKQRTARAAFGPRTAAPSNVQAASANIAVHGVQQMLQAA